MRARELPARPARAARRCRALGEVAGDAALEREHALDVLAQQELLQVAADEDDDRIVAEVKYNWGDDLQKPTLQHMLEMFDRHLALIWQYRFFYRELTALLAADEHLRERYGRDRQDRTRVVIDFFQALIDNDVLTGPRDLKTLRNLVKASWIICDNWINYLSVDRPAVYPDCVQEGSQLVIDLFRSYLSPRTLILLNTPAPELARARSN